MVSALLSLTLYGQKHLFKWHSVRHPLLRYSGDREVSQVSLFSLTDMQAHKYWVFLRRILIDITDIRWRDHDNHSRRCLLGNKPRRPPRSAPSHDLLGRRQRTSSSVARERHGRLIRPHRRSVAETARTRRRTGETSREAWRSVDLRAAVY